MVPKQEFSEQDQSCANSLIKRWELETENLSDDAKETIAAGYLLEVLGVDGKTALRYVTGNDSAKEEIGKRMAGIKTYESHLETFWRSVAAEFPALVRAEEVNWLCGTGGEEAVTRLILGLGGPLPKTTTPILRRLRITMHVYK